MHGGLQIAIGRHFQQFADIDDKGAGARLSVDPVAVGGLDLQPLLPFLQPQRQEAAVLVGADALLALGRVTAGITDDLDEMVGRAGIDGFEGVLVLLQDNCEGLQQARREVGQAILPFQQKRLQFVSSWPTRL